MELREAAQYIRDAVGMQSILDLYGYRPKHGFMVCPFHGDHDASLKVYTGNKGWHCYGCGRGGSVIDFVMEHDGCDFRTAVKAIDLALGLDLLQPGDPFEEGRKQQLNRILDEMAGILLDWIDREQQMIESVLRYRTRQTMQIEGKEKQTRTASEWAELQNLYEEMQYQEYRKEKLRELREEVRTWRREKRRAKKAV